MGPLGFQVIINDAASETSAKVWKYVDDLTLASNVTDSATNTLQDDLDNFVSWSTNNNLTLNPSKCQGLQVCFMRAPPTPTLCIDDVPLDFVKCAKILGIWLQEDLKWEKQVKEMLKKANCRMYMLRTLKRFGFNSEELNVIYKGYVRPLLDYGDVAWGASLTCDQSTTLEKVQKRACRIMLGKKYSSYTDAIDKCGLETLSDRRKNHSRKFAKSLPKCKRTSNLIPATRLEKTGRNLRNSDSISRVPFRTERFRKSPIPNFINLLNNMS